MNKNHTSSFIRHSLNSRVLIFIAFAVCLLDVTALATCPRCSAIQNLQDRIQVLKTHLPASPNPAQTQAQINNLEAQLEQEKAKKCECNNEPPSDPNLEPTSEPTQG